MTIKVLIVDDHMVVREGLRMLLRPRYGIQVIGEAVDGEEAIQIYSQLKPDVVLMDLIMPRKDGIYATSEILAADPHAKILILTSSAEDSKIVSAIQAGALGYILKDTSAKELLHAIEEVNKGNLSLQASIAQKLSNHLQAKQSEIETAPATPLQETLTSRELEVARLIAQGMSNRQIATHLFLSEITVRTHVSNALKKLELGSRTQLALFAVRNGLIDLDSTTN
jgi:two-component system, NarL family, response regulator LiaR